MNIILDEIKKRISYEVVIYMSIGYPSVRVSCSTRQHHWNLDKEYKKASIPRLIWNDGHAEWSRWYFFKDRFDRVGYKYSFK